MTPIFDILRRICRLAKLGKRGDCPHAEFFCWLGHLALLVCLFVPISANAEPHSDTGDLDGWVVAVGPSGGVARQLGDFEFGFGGELSLTRVREKSALSVLGLSGGGWWFSERSGGRAWAELQIGTNRILGVTIGLAAGGSLELDNDRPPRAGAHGTLWVFAGVIPYLRIGATQTTGEFVDIGLRIPLPVFRWN